MRSLPAACIRIDLLFNCSEHEQCELAFVELCWRGLATNLIGQNEINKFSNFRLCRHGKMNNFIVLRLNEIRCLRLCRHQGALLSRILQTIVRRMSMQSNNDDNNKCFSYRLSLSYPCASTWAADGKRERERGGGLQRQSQLKHQQRPAQGQLKRIEFSHEQNVIIAVDMMAASVRLHFAAQRICEFIYFNRVVGSRITHRN